MTVYPDLTQLGHPVKIVTGLNRPYGIAFNSCGEMIISECGSHQISIFDIRGQKSRTFGSHGESPKQMKEPAGIAIDDADNIYVSSLHKLQKFTSSGELIKCIGQNGSEKGNFKDPRGITLFKEQVYVCDRDNGRIQVFDLDLNFIESISPRGSKGEVEFNAPFDVEFDSAGNMYIAEYSKKRVQVLHVSGLSEGRGQQLLTGPTGVHIVDKYMYVSDFDSHCIVVYETSGQFVTSFGMGGHNEGKFDGPYSITSCADGFIYVCDYRNNRIQIF